MRINKTTASDYALQNMSKNLSFQALKVEKNALKGFGVRGSKKLLKNINSLDELASRADVFIKKGDKIGNKLVSAPFIANIEPQDGKMLNMGVAQADKKLLALSNRLLDKLVEKRKH